MPVLPDASEPWYRRPLDPHPYRISKKIASKAADSPDYRSVACFPWNRNSLSVLWEGSMKSDAHIEPWNALVSKYWDAVAVGADHRAYIFFTHSKKHPICIKMPENPPEKLISADKICVAWAVGHKALSEPLLIITRGSLVYIYNPESQGMAGYLRGHGGAITSVAVHPTRPHMFCTTSRDHTTRIYDLSLPPMDQPNNPHWPPSQYPSSAGAAHGLHMNEREGSGIGRCIVVLMGGRSGGHQAAVLGAAFHVNQPLIATCGVDRCVKIWAVRPASDNRVLTREDKPVFSSSRIHKARVTSVTWLQDDILLTHAAPAVMRNNPLDTEDKTTYLEPGEIAVWRWLGLNRFFPPDKQNVKQTVLRGCASDYQESSSFKCITVYSLKPVPDQYTTPHLHVYASPAHDPIALTTFPVADSLLVTNIAKLSPRKMPAFSEMLPHLVAMDDLMNDLDDLHIEDEEDEVPAVKRRAAPRYTKPAFQPPLLPGWEIKLPEGSTATLNCTAVTGEGRFIVGVGSKSTIWVWKRDDRDAAGGPS